MSGGIAKGDRVDCGEMSPGDGPGLGTVLRLRKSGSAREALVKLDKPRTPTNYFPRLTYSEAWFSVRSLRPVSTRESRAHAEGAAAEREAIVAWIRAHADQPPRVEADYRNYWLADEIERGAHREQRK